MAYYTMYKDGLLIGTNDKAVIEQAVKGGYGSGSITVPKETLLYLNMKLDHREYPERFVNNFFINNPNAEAAMEMSAMMETLEVISDDDPSVVLKLKEDKKNSFARLLEMASKMQAE